MALSQRVNRWWFRERIHNLIHGRKYVINLTKINLFLSMRRVPSPWRRYQLKLCIFCTMRIRNFKINKFSKSFHIMFKCPKLILILLRYLPSTILYLIQSKYDLPQSSFPFPHRLVYVIIFLWFRSIRQLLTLISRFTRF